MFPWAITLQIMFGCFVSFLAIIRIIKGQTDHVFLYVTWVVYERYLVQLDAY